MIEFYNKYFKKNYTSKVKQLIVDITRLCELESIPILYNQEIVLNKEFQKSLNEKIWIEINSLYNTLYKNKKNLSPTLTKFINKKENNANSKGPKCIDTFAGCGGLSLGLKASGFSPVLINEIEAKYLESYYFNHTFHINNYHCGDIKDLVDDQDLIANFSNIDLIVGGPPCQGFSMANRQRVLDDPRNILYKHFLNILGNLKPKFFIMENVKGMMKKSDEILENFQSVLGKEYSISIQLFNARDFGIPQNRERVFVIGSKVASVTAKSIIDDVLSQRSSFKTIAIKEALFGLPILKPKREKNSRGLENDEIGYKFKMNGYVTNDFINSISGKRITQYLSNHTNRFNNDRDIDIFGRLPQEANSLHESIKEIMPYSSRNLMFKDKYFKLDENEVSKTITSHMKLDCNMYIHPNQPRGLSPREAARIQTFPDDFVFMEAKKLDIDLKDGTLQSQYLLIMHKGFLFLSQTQNRLN